MSIKLKLFVFILLTLLLFILYSLLNRASHPAVNTIFSEDFETGVILAKCSGNCPTVSQKFVNNGKYSMEVHLNKNKSKIRYRTEIQEENKAIFGDKYWYQFSVYLPVDYVSDDTWEIIAQWHAVPDFILGEKWRNPVLSLRTTNGVWGIKSIWDSKENTFEGGNREYSGSKTWGLGTYEVNKWVTWKFHIVWSHLDNGIIEVWKNGKLVISKYGPNCFNDKIGPYFKVGLYKGWKDRKKTSTIQQRTLYFDDILISK